MNLNINTPQIRQYLASLAGNSVFTHSESKVKRARTERQIEQYQAHIAPAKRNYIKQTATTDPNSRIAWCSASGKVCAGNTVMIVQNDRVDPPQQFVLFRSGDSFAGDTMGSMTIDSMHRVGICVVTDKNATAMKMHRCSAQIGTLKKTDGSMATYADLHFDEPATAADAPVAVVMDKVLTIPPGYAIPVGHDVRDPFPADTDEVEYYPVMRAWCEAMGHHFNHYAGFSLQVNDKNGDLDTSNFTSNEPKGEFFDECIEIGANLGQALFTRFNIMIGNTEIA